MKKLNRILSVILIICLCFTAFAFAADESETVTVQEEDGDTEDILAEDTGTEETGTAPSEEGDLPEEGTEEPASVSEELPEEASPVVIDFTGGDAVSVSEERPDGLNVIMPSAEAEEALDEEPVISYEDEPLPEAETEMMPEPRNMTEAWLSHGERGGLDTDLVTLDDIPWGEGGRDLNGGEGPEQLPKLHTAKQIPLVVLVVGFSNINYTTNYNWASTIFTASDSLAQYYKDQSVNQFTFVPAAETSVYGTGGNNNTNDKKNDGIVHVKINLPHEDWTLSGSGQAYINSLVSEAKAIKAAIQASDAYVNYSSYDANGDGVITTNEMGLAVVMAGYEGAFDSSHSMGSQYYVWSHAWALSGASYYDSSFTLPSPDGVKVDNFITIPECLESGKQEPISVLAHELGHYLGLPDLYDTDSGSNKPWYNYQVGAVSIMAGGPWTWNGSKYIPSGMDAWCKCALGWVKPAVVQDGTYTVQSVQGTYNVLMVQTNNPNEYYLIENRRFTGWDAGLANYSNGAYSSYASTGGIIVWHIDDEIYEKYDPGNTPNGTTHRPAVMPIYPEKASTGAIAFTGTLPSSWIYRPFFTSTVWSNYYSGTLGNWMTLPMYNGCANPSGRTYTGISMRFLTGSQTSMQVQFSGTVKAALVDRIAGPNRYKTAFDAADYRNEFDGNGGLVNVVIASGMDYADALAGSYLAIKENAPILLVNSSTVNEVAGYVKANLRSTGRVFILGGTGAVPASMETALKNKGISATRITRLFGPNRYDTNLEILKYEGEKGYLTGEYLMICYGLDYADSLSASALGYPILLTSNKGLTASQKSFLSTWAKRVSTMICVGGEGVISNKTAWDIYYYKNPSFDPYNATQEEANAQDITRCAGANRYATSAKVASWFFSSPNKIYLAYGLNYPDGLSGGPIAFEDHAPMILVTNSNTSYARSYVSSAGSKYCTVMGGKALISDYTAYYIMGRY